MCEDPGTTTCAPNPMVSHSSTQGRRETKAEVLRHTDLPSAMARLPLVVVFGSLFSVLLLTAFLPVFPITSAIDIPSVLDGLLAGAWSDFKSLLNAGLGDKRDALAPLKTYFARFGYLNLTFGKNVTTIFDEQTLAAVKLYQESFNLSVSGKLDLHTLAKIMTPRCGREDVVSGIPLMIQSHLASSNRSLHIMEHYSFFPTQPSWPDSRRNLTYAFNMVNETQRVDMQERKQVFHDAFAEWAAVIPVNFTEVNDYETADVKIEFVSYSHGDGEPFDGILGILGHAFSPTDGRFHLDDSEYWYVSSVSSSGGPHYIDLQSVVTHEIGHLLGLAHTNVESAIMYPALAPGQVKLQLQQDDIQGAQALYGANPSYNPNKSMPDSHSSLADVNRDDARPSFTVLHVITIAIIVAHLSFDRFQL